VEAARARGEPSRVTVEIEIDGHHHRLELQRIGGGWSVTLGDRAFEVDARRSATGWSLLIERRGGDAEDGPGQASYDVSVDQRSAGESIVYVNGRTIRAHLVDPRGYARRGRGLHPGGGSRNVTSAMPGRIVKVLVSAGQHVTAQQGLVVVEAMKMENELRAFGDGVVREVRVSEGASVEAGAILIVLE
jgi:biotin carboxyl carrier protein